MGLLRYMSSEYHCYSQTMIILLVYVDHWPRKSWKDLINIIQEKGTRHHIHLIITRIDLQQQFVEIYVSIT